MADIVLERRNHDFMAFEKGHRERWESGVTEREAHQRLFQSRPECQGGAVERDAASYESTRPCWIVHDLLNLTVSA